VTAQREHRCLFYEMNMHLCWQNQIIASNCEEALIVVHETIRNYGKEAISSAGVLKFAYDGAQALARYGWCGAVLR
jgi:hypothetical protein